MASLLEVDVTIARERIARHRALTGETLSFTAFLTACLGRAVGEDTTVQAYRRGRTQLAVFDDVDVSLMIERPTGAEHELSAHVVRRANHKSHRQIHDEIRAAQLHSLTTDRGTPAWFRSVMLLPWPFIELAKSALVVAMRRDPRMLVSMAGTVAISSVGMFLGGKGGWGIAAPVHSLELFVGGTVRKPAVVDDRIEARDFLNISVIFDHDIIDGAPAARFTRRLVELIESAYGFE